MFKAILNPSAEAFLSNRWTRLLSRQSNSRASSSLLVLQIQNPLLLASSSFWLPSSLLEQAHPTPARVSALCHGWIFKRKNSVMRPGLRALPAL